MIKFMYVKINIQLHIKENESFPQICQQSFLPSPQNSRDVQNLIRVHVHFIHLNACNKYCNFNNHDNLPS